MLHSYRLKLQNEGSVNMEINSTHHLLSQILTILKLMVEAGAEIYRVEESAKLIFGAYNFKNVDIFATTSNIILSVEDSDGVIKTHTRRIVKIYNDMEKVHSLNSLVREITAKKPDLEYIDAQIKKIGSAKKYPAVVEIAFYGIIVGAFYFFFGGRSFLEFAFSVVVGLCTGVLNHTFEKLDFNKILAKFLLSFVAALVTFVLRQLNAVANTEYIIIANIMTLIPGTGLTNSLRDLFVGDNISGVLRLIEAGLSALSIAGGYIAVLALFGGVL